MEEASSTSARRLRDFWPLWLIGGLFVYVFGVVAFWAPDDKAAKDLAQTVGLCRAESLCADYPSARNVCATAGSFGKCMEIKLGTREDFATAKAVCTNDGTVNAGSEKLPGWSDCMIARWKFSDKQPAR